jgi:hypothetical protein
MANCKILLCYGYGFFHFFHPHTFCDFFLLLDLETKNAKLILLDYKWASKKETLIFFPSLEKLWISEEQRIPDFYSSTICFHRVVFQFDY